MTERPGSSTQASVIVVENGKVVSRTDQLATEEPLEIRIKTRGETKTLAITMRTPGADFDLATGFLFAEGVVGSKEQIRTIAYCRDPGVDIEQLYNIVTVDLDDSAHGELPSLERHFTTSSSCGVCGKANLDALSLRGSKPLPDGPEVDPGVIKELPDELRKAQKVFESTGGLHAAGLFDRTGDLVDLREDVGRHNAVDKLIGSRLMAKGLPAAEEIVRSVADRASRSCRSASSQVSRSCARCPLPAASRFRSPRSST